MSGVPLFAKVLVSAPADTSGDFMLHLSPTPFVDHDDIYGDYGSFGDPPRFHSDTIDYFSIPFNTETQIFSWFTEDAGYFVTTQDGLWSLAGALPRGGELTDPNLHPRDSVKVVCDPSIYPMGLDLVLFHSETYQPFPAFDPLPRVQWQCPVARNDRILRRLQSLCRKSDHTGIQACATR